MAKLLVVQTSVRGASSVSRTMTERFLDAWRAEHADARVVERDLAATPLTFASAKWLQAYFTPADAQSAETRSMLALSDELVAELLDADHIVISTPVYNYNVPAALKAWIDHIVRKGLTLGFDGSGLATGKKATVLLASGGVYTAGSPIADRDVASQYLRLILNVIGVDDVAFVAGGGAKAVDMGETTIEAFVGSREPEIAAAAIR